MPTCVASGCTNSPGRTAAANNVSFHRFPFHNPSLLAKWIGAVGRNDWSPSKQSCLCSDHFTPRDFLRSDRHSLKETSVPSKFKRLLSTRPKKAEQFGKKEILSDDKGDLKTKARKIPQSESNAKVGFHQIKAKRKPREVSSERPAASMNTKRMKGQQSKKLQADVMSEDIQLTNKSDIRNLATKSTELQSTSESKGNLPKTSSGGSKPTNNKPKGIRHRKILKTSSDESDDELEVTLLTGKTDKEMLSAVRVELDDYEASDDEHSATLDKWTKTGIDTDKLSYADVGTVVPGEVSTSVLCVKQSALYKQMKPSCAIPADKDHVVAVNERRTRYRYIYRVGQCFPEEDDDIPFTKSKLDFVIKALQSQNEKMRALQKKCRVLSSSNATLRDILGIPSTDASDELMDKEDPEEQPQAYLIIGSHPSSATSLPSYRFTLTDHSPTTISLAAVN